MPPSSPDKLEGVRAFFASTDKPCGWVADFVMNEARGDFIAHSNGSPFAAMGRQCEQGLIFCASHRSKARFVHGDVHGIFPRVLAALEVTGHVLGEKLVNGAGEALGAVRRRR